LKFEEKQDEFEFATTILFEFEVAGKNKMNNSLDLTPLLVLLLDADLNTQISHLFFHVILSVFQLFKYTLCACEF
jgi:hypothetical protein